MYPAEIVVPMKAELTDNGFEEMNTAGDVDNSLRKRRNHAGDGKLGMRLRGWRSAPRCADGGSQQHQTPR